jgi:ribose-phosphate pyrophosphokinase
MVFVNGEKFNDKEFHNGEVIFEKPHFILEDKNCIELIFKDNRDITAVLFARAYLNEVAPNAECYLRMLYCPYERMDREINDQMFSMKYFAEIIGKADFTKVFILDQHSEVCVNMLREHGVNVEIVSLLDYVKHVVDDFKPDYICYPDKGAHKKYTEVLKDIDIPVFFGEKKRDLANCGRITDYKLVGAPDLTGKRVLIVDDICCLGGTAYNAATEMKLAGASEVAFYISHCEDGIFAGKILARQPFYPDGSGENLPWAGKYTIDKVYTADTMGLKDYHKNIIRVSA